jgi:ribose 5-phosphate isomerase RpiB
MKIGIATDHGSFGLKAELVTRMRDVGHKVIDFGAHNLKGEYLHKQDRPMAVKGLNRNLF